MDGSCTFLDSEAPPWLVFCDWAISVHDEVLRFAVIFQWEAWLFCLLPTHDSAFPGFLAGVSRRNAGIDLGTFPTPWFVWAVSWHNCSIESSAWSIQDFPRPRLHPFVSFTASWSGLWGFSTTLNYALTCFTFCLVCIGGRFSMNLVVSMGVLGGSEYDSHRLVLHSVQL